MKAITPLLVLATLCSSARADKLDDFKDAVTRDGCDSIPYTDLRNHCRSQQSDVHPWCDGSRGPVSCDGTSTNELRANLVRVQRKLAELTDKRRDLDDKRSHASDDNEKAKWTLEIEAVEKEIETARKEVEAATSDLERRGDFVEKAIYTIGKCIDYRRAVMNVFAYATDKVRGETEPDIKPYADMLRNKYPQHIAGHETQIVSRTNAVENCKKERP
jgi:CDGSH-type Zn-finger protein